MSVTLLSADGTAVTISESAARLSGLVATMLPDDGSQMSEPIPLADRPECKAEVVRTAASFLQLAAAQADSEISICRPLPSDNLRDGGCPEWAACFMESLLPRSALPAAAAAAAAAAATATATAAAAAAASAPSSAAAAAAPADDAERGWPLVFDVLRLADYLDIKPLVNLCGAAVAARYVSWTDAQRAVIFKPAKPYTPEEEQAIRSRNAWAESDPDFERELLAADGAAAASSGGAGR